MQQDEMKNNCECGLWKETNGSFTLIEPSDCHDLGGHYMTSYDKYGKFVSTNAPWQVGDRSDDLTQEEMELAQS